MLGKSSMLTDEIGEKGSRRGRVQRFSSLNIWSILIFIIAYTFKFQYCTGILLISFKIGIENLHRLTPFK